MKKSRLIAGFLALVMAIPLLTSCGDSSSSGGNPGDNVGNNKEKKTLTFCTWGDRYEQLLFEEIFEKFSSIPENSHIKVRLQLIPKGDFMTKMNTMAASKTLPDLGQFEESATLYWAEKGMFEDVSDLYTSGQVNKKLDMCTYAPINGVDVGPSFINEIYSVWYSKDIFDKMNVEYPPASTDEGWTWDDFVQTAIKLTVDKNGKHPNEAGFDYNNVKTYGINMGRGTLAWLPFALSNGGGLVSPDNSELWLDKPETIEAIQNLADLSLKYKVMPSPAQAGAVPYHDTAFLTEQVAMTIDGTWSLQWLSKSVTQRGLNLGVSFLPKYKTYATVNTGPAIVIFKSSKNIAEAKELYKYFYDTDNILDHLHTGEWMASEENWYTDETLKDQWVDTEFHPDEYKTAVIDFTYEYGRSTPWYTLSCFSQLVDIIDPAMDNVWNGKRTAEDVIKNDIMPKIKPIFEASKKK